MRTLACLTIGLSVFLVGCQEPTMDMSMMEMKKPSPAPELAKLERMVGSWDSTWKMVEPEMEGEAMTGTGSGKASWTLGGMYLKWDGAIDMGDGMMMNYVEFMTWDAKARKYRSWFFSDWGECGEGEMTLSADGNTMKSKFSGLDAAGNTKSGSGDMTWINNDSITWSFSEHGPQGTMKMEGTSTRSN